MKKNLSLMLAGAIVVLGMCVSDEVTYVAASEYQKSYGEQLSQKDNSRLIYDKMVEAYIYQAGDAGNVDGRYTGMAQSVNSQTKKLDIDATGYSYKINVSNMTSAQIETERNALIQTATDDLMADVMAAFDSFVKDYPEVYWLYSAQTSINYTAFTYGTNMTISISEAYFIPTEYVAGMSGNVAAYNDAVISTKEKIKKEYSITDASSDAEVTKAIHDYLATELEYNYGAATAGIKGNNAYAYSSMPVFVEISGCSGVVCEGYAEAFGVLCDQFQIENAIITGTAINNSGNVERHMWNDVKIDGKWYAVDVTWDDQAGKIYYNYFLAGQNSKGFQYTFAQDHFAETKNSGYEYSMTFVLPSVEYSGHPLNETNPKVVKVEKEQKTNTSSNTTKTVVHSTKSTTTVAKQKVSRISIKKAKFSKVKTQKYKKGKACKPKIKVTYNGKKLKKNKDYKVTYNNNKKKGTAKIIIKGKGNFKSKKVIKFKIK